MTGRLGAALSSARGAVQSIAQGLIGLVAAGLVAASVAAAFGWLPWPQVALFFGGQAVPQAGMWLQLGLTASKGRRVRGRGSGSR